jgi:hypothetical protein
MKSENINQNNKMRRDRAIVLAWPETLCKRAGAWYDGLMEGLSLCKDGYYKVGHAAIVLVDGRSGDAYYFDFGRYHAPKGYGRVRDCTTDHDLKIHTKIIFDEEDEILNLEELLGELSMNASCHGDGELRGSEVEIDFNESYQCAKEMQSSDFIPYGPFVANGTNCSRFVQNVALSGMPMSSRKVLMRFPLTLSPTPLWNVNVGSKRNISPESKIASV